MSVYDFILAFSFGVLFVLTILLVLGEIQRWRDRREIARIVRAVNEIPSEWNNPYKSSDNICDICGFEAKNKHGVEIHISRKHK